MPTKALEGIPFIKGMPAFKSLLPPHGASQNVAGAPVEILLVSPVVSRSNPQIGIWKVFGPPSQVVGSGRTAWTRREPQPDAKVQTWRQNGTP